MLGISGLELVLERFDDAAKIDSRLFLKSLRSSLSGKENQNAMEHEVSLERFTSFFTFIQNAQKELAGLFGANDLQINKIRKESEDISAFECILVVDKYLLE
jgi:hypothetical protein